MLNTFQVMGRLVADPELRHTNGGTPVPVCSFRIACDRDFKRDNEKETDFFNCVAWRATAEFISTFFAKGRMIVLSGRLRDKEWTDKDGVKRYDKEIVVENTYFGDSKPKNVDEGTYMPPTAPDGCDGSLLEDF